MAENDRTPYQASPFFRSVFFPKMKAPGALDVFFENAPNKSSVVSLRKALYEFIILARDGLYLQIPDFNIEESYLPIETLIELNKNNPEGKLYISQVPNDEENRSRQGLAYSEVGVMFSFVKGKVDAKDVDAIDELVTFMEQLKYVCRHFDQHESYAWGRNEVMKDENNAPYGYVWMTQSNVFQSYFTAFFKTVTI